MIGPGSDTKNSFEIQGECQCSADFFYESLTETVLMLFSDSIFIGQLLRLSSFRIKQDGHKHALPF